MMKLIAMSVVAAVVALGAAPVVGQTAGALAEARERVRSAMACCGHDVRPRRQIVNLAPADLPKAQPVTIDLPNDHLGYAITWYGLAVVLLVIYIMSSLSKPEAAEP